LTVGAAANHASHLVDLVHMLAYFLQLLLA